MAEKYWYLKNCNLFEQLTPEELQKVEAKCRIREFPRGSPIYLPADAADGVLLLATGRVKICGFTPEGKQSIVALVEPGEVFGELALFAAENREEYAEASKASRVVFIPTVEIQRLMAEHPQVSFRVTRLLGLRRKRIERRLKYLLFHNSRDRLIHLLLELAEHYGRPSAEGVLIGVKLSHQDMANIIGSSRETVTLGLGDLQAEGQLRVVRRQIILEDIDRLAATVNAAAPRVAEGQEKKMPESPHGALKSYS